VGQLSFLSASLASQTATQSTDKKTTVWQARATAAIDWTIVGGAIGGGCALICVVICLIAVCVIRRRRRRELASDGRLSLPIAGSAEYGQTSAQEPATIRHREFDAGAE
jgi:hypothetical protein